MKFTSADLPIQAFIPQIQQTLANHSCCILQAEPGAGKSTQVPLALLDSAWLKGKKIILLEPRRLAVRALADYLAQQLDETIGQRIGYQVRNEHKTSPQTQLEIMTEGILIRRLQQDPELQEIGLIIFDEFHERSLEADLALGFCLDSQSALRPDLKLLLMSATLESGQLSQFLNNAPIIQCPGRSFPVEIHYLTTPIPKIPDLAFYNQLSKTLQHSLQTQSGDCLIFLAGQKEIFKAIQLVSAAIDPQQVTLIPLYGGLSPAQQSKALDPDPLGRRKVIFATNIAETSLTIDGIHCVIDSGLVRRASYDASSGMTRLLTQNISNASATQRAGRAGRLAPGQAYRLWTRAEHHQRPEFETEAILNSDLTDLSLEIAMWGLQSPDELQWLTPPPAAHYQMAKSLLIQLGFLNEKGHVTPLGEAANQLGVAARIAKMLLVAASQNKPETLRDACDLAAIISERDILRNAHSVNLLERLQALQGYRQNSAAQRNDATLQLNAAKEALINSQKWLQRLQAIYPERASAMVRQSATNQPITQRAPDNQPGLVTLEKNQFSIAQLLALAYPDRIAKRRAANDNRYQLSNGKGVVLHESDALNKEAWLVVTHLDGQRRDGKVFLAIAISLPEIQSLFHRQISVQEVIYFDNAKQQINGVKNHQLGALILESQPITKLTSEQIQTCLIDTLKTSQLQSFPWSEPVLDWLARVRWLAQYLPNFNGFSQADLIESFDEWCAPYLGQIKSWADLKNLDTLGLLQAKLGYQHLPTLEHGAPTHYTAPSGKQKRIHYQLGKQPSVAIQLQELFGETTSPKLALGQVPLTFELLSPAQRPIQITSDLGLFWVSSYLEIAKEMRGKYPKHRWPEKPLDEKAGRSLKAHKAATQQT